MCAICRKAKSRGAILRTSINTAESLAQLREALESHPSAGLVGPLVLYRSDPERVWAAGGRLTFRPGPNTGRITG